MADYERTIIGFSLDDVIHILEHEPVQPDMVPEITISRIMNRGPIAHLAIERALKFLIEKANGTWEEHHNLHTHLEYYARTTPTGKRVRWIAFESVKSAVIGREADRKLSASNWNAVALEGPEGLGARFRFVS